MGWISQKFADIGLVFFGVEWKKPMANVLEVDEAQIDAWVADPATLPDDIEGKIKAIGEERIEEIQTFLYLIKEAGVSRENGGEG